jgi:hypothetical protein
MKRYHRLWWWLWVLTGVALVASLAGWGRGLPLAVALTLVQVTHQGMRTGGLTAMSVQTRFLFLFVLLVGAASPALRVLHVVQVAGIVVRVGLDYCVASRLLALMPWNRREPLTPAFLAATFRPHHA